MFCASDHGFDFDAFMFGSRRQRRGRHAKWKIFERGDLKFVILRLVSEQPMHGYEVMKALEKESGGYYRPSPGSVYPTLQLLEDEGYVTVEEQDGKKIYSITDAGQAYLDENEDVIDDVFERVEHFTDRFFGRDMKELSKSFSRLAQLTFDQALQWGAEPEDLARMNDILEQAVHDMEEARRSARKRRRSPSREKARKGRRAGRRHKAKDVEVEIEVEVEKDEE
jgi:DNA-binding PadR family transcriptional regulator